MAVVEGAGSQAVVEVEDAEVVEEVAVEVEEDDKPVV